MHRLFSISAVVAVSALLVLPTFAQTNTPTPAPIAPLSIDSGESLIEYTQSVEGELTVEAPSRTYTFSGSAGDTVVIKLVSVNAGFDAFLRLNDTNDIEVATNDDSGGTLNSQIGPFTLAESGTHTIVASSLSGSATGTFILGLDRIESQAIAYGDEITLEFSERDREFYLTFDGSYGDLVDIFVDADRANPVDTSLSLLDSNSSTVTSDEDSGSGSSPEIVGFSLYGEGTFTILLTSPESDSVGEVVLSLIKREADSLDETSQTLRFSSTITQVPLVFSGVAGEEVRLTLTVQDNLVSSSLSVAVRQGDSSVSDVNVYNTKSVSFDFVIPVDGDLSVLVSEYSYSNVEVEVTLERQG